MSATPMLSRCLSSSMTSRIWACTVTSRAVVGSSAMSRSGSSTSAIAIIARCRMPPENSCGYWRARCSGAGMPTRRSASTARSRASRLLTLRCARIASAIWSPTRYIGCIEVIGSWKIIPMRSPRMCRSSSLVASSRFRPSNRTSPDTCADLRLMRPITVRNVMLLPDPDSPTMPQRVAALDGEAHPSTAFHHAVRGGEVDPQVADLQQHVAHW